MTKSRVYNNGGYIYIDNDLVKGWHECEPGEFFAYQPEYTDQLKDSMAKWVGAKIPKDIMALALSAIAYKPDTEVDLCLYYNRKEGQWMIHLPKQRGGGASVSYDDSEYKQPAGYIFQGTIHSHPNMSAFWSGTDFNDQKGKSGIHIVVGTDHGKLRSMLCDLWINGKTYTAADAVEMPEGDLPELSKEWIDILNEPMPEPVVKQSIWTTPYTGTSTLEDKRVEDWLDHYMTYTKDTPEPVDYLEELYSGATPKEMLKDACKILSMLGYEDIADEVEARITPDIEGASDSAYYYPEEEMMDNCDVEAYLPPEAKL